MKRVLIGVATDVAIAAAFVAVAVMLRGDYLSTTSWLNPDEAELMAQARAAMRSPVPFTTWVTTTTGPVWVLFLALLGKLGLPMTLAFAHFVAAFVLGLMGYLGFVLVRRWTGTALSVVITVFWWLPIVVVLTGNFVDFAALSTELLPSALLLAAAAIFRTEMLAQRPLLFVAFGLVCGLALGAKYQVAPLALVLFVVQVILIGDLRWKTILRCGALWGAGLLLPFVVIGLSMLLSPDVSSIAIEQNLNFLSDYTGRVTLYERFIYWRDIVTQMHVVILLLVVIWFGTRSTPRVQLCRTILVLAGLAAVFAGGLPFRHYLIIVYAAMVLAIALPLKPGAQLIPYVRHRLALAAIAGVAAVLAWLISFGPDRGTVNFANDGELTTALSANSVQRDPKLNAVCPAGSKVLIWGWAPDLYVHYSWENVIPFMNVTQLTLSQKNYASGAELIRQAIENRSTDCVLDAVGPPFFGVQAKYSLTTHYPELRALLDRDYRQVGGVVDCEACAVYVRR